MGKTIKVFSILGINCYVRWLDSRWYELDVVYKGGLYVHQLWCEKAHKNERRLSRAELDECAVKELSIAATVLVGNLIKERSLINQSKKLWQKTKEWLWVRAKWTRKEPAVKKAKE